MSADEQLITQEYLKTRLDYLDGCLYWKPKPVITDDDKRWNNQFAGTRAGCLRPDGYRHVGLKIEGKERRFLEHQFVWLWHKGYWPEYELDHINGKRDDNHIENFREVDHTENSKNKRIYKNNTSDVTGVSWRKDIEKWRAYIKVYGKSIHLGYFADKFKAICARKSADIKYGYHKNHGRPA